MSRNNKGFTLIELLIIIAIIGITAVMVVPSLLRVRMQQNEASAIKSLRAINSAQKEYAKKCGDGFYAPSLLQLGTTPKDVRSALLESDLTADPATKSGYTFKLTPGPTVPDTAASCIKGGPVVASYFVEASPNPGSGVRHYFAANVDGVYQSTASIPVTRHGPPPGSTPVE